MPERVVPTGWRRWCLGAMALMLAGVALVAQGKEAQPASDDPQLEARVLVIAEELRCLVCQNETIAASQADLAVDLRKQIRLKLQQGQSQQQILDFMVERYGDFVLYRPPWSARTVLLWLGPFGLLVIAVVTMAINVRRRRRAATAQEWSEAQAQRAQALLGNAPDPS